MTPGQPLSRGGVEEGLAGVEDVELARRIQCAGPQIAEGEEAELCRRYARRLYHFGLRHLRADDRARDLVQSVLLVTLQRLRAGEVRDLARIGSFILGTARLMSRSMARTERREQAIDGAPFRALSIDPETADPLARDAVAQCLEKLQERQRTVVVLTYYAEQSTEAIAASLGLTSNNVRVIRHRGIARLRTCLGFGGVELEA